MSNIKVNADLIKERQQASFSKEELTNLIDGGEEKTTRRKELEAEFYKDPELNDMDKVPVDYLSHSEIYENAIKKSMAVYHKAMDLADPQEILTIADAVLHEASPFAVHFVMFIPALMGMASEEQQARWLPPALEMKIIGSYAQTELGHGTFLRGLETRATYDASSHEFVLHTPNLSSVKWWPGSLGKTANHAVVLAQLYTKGKCHGIHPFMVQLRDMETHQPLAGITVGEIGPKMGMRASDNGFLKLDHVRIPRDHMFMKNAQVTVEGDYSKPKSDKLNYGTMVFVRVIIIDFVAFNLARALTIAIRYSAVRRQSEIVQNTGREVQILDYQAQQYKLFPGLALSHALKATFMHLMDVYKNSTRALEKGDLATLPELHAMTSGIKAVATELGSGAVETCRKACGGHGYLLISGLPRLYAATVAACTYEGENTVLYLQTARYLMKVLNRQAELSRVSPMAYLVECEPQLEPFDPNNLDRLVSLYCLAAHRLVHDSSKQLSHSVAAGKLYDIAWNQNQINLTRGAKAHIVFYIVEKYVEWIGSLQVSNQLHGVLSRLCHLFLCYHIVEQPGPFLAVGLTPQQLNEINLVLCGLLSDIRPDAVALVDSFDFDDLVLNSALGSYDGNVYERMFRWAQKTPLNRTQVHESFHKYIQPATKSKL